MVKLAVVQLMTEDQRRKAKEVAKVVDTALIQCAETSRLRDWLIYRGLKQLEFYQAVDGGELVAEKILMSFDELIFAFEDMIDQDDKEFFSSEIFKSGPMMSEYDFDDPVFE